MSLITRCPACATMFKLVPDQLRISAGWVRCGQCGVVFDASAQMLSYAEAAAVEAEAAQRRSAPVATPSPTVAPSPASASWPVVPATTNAPTGATSSPEPVAPPLPQPRIEPPAPAPVPAPARAPEPVAPPAPLPQPATKPVEAVTDTGDSVPPARAADQPSVTADEIARWRAERTVPGSPEAGAQPVNRAVFDDEPAEIHEVDLYLSSLDDGTRDQAEDGVMDEAMLGASPAEAAAEADLADRALADASFVRQARRRAFWRSAPVRVGLWLVLLALLAGLALQFALGRREWLAAAYPATEPALQQLCRLTGCEVGPYRHLDGMVVESSSFARVTGNVYQLNITLRNKAVLRVATPSFELTLTDAQDQPLLRRVISPTELGAPATVAAGGEFAGTARLTLGELPANAAVIGYRVLAFYP